MHWAKRNREKKAWHELVYFAWAQAGKPTFKKASVRFTYYFKDLRLRDKDNYQGKWLLDGLKGHAFADDNYKCVDLEKSNFEYDKDNPHTVITIQECE